MTGGSRGSVLGSLRTLFGVGTVGGMMDGQLLEQFLSRRDEAAAEAAFAALVAFHGPMVWDVCRGILCDAHAAEDAFQATFLVLVRRAGSIRRRDAVGPWLHGVARRIAVRARAVAARRRLREGQEQEKMATSEPDPTRGEQFEALHEEVDRLAEKYRAPLVLCYFEGRTHAEAARLLRCPVGTVSVRLSRARELLRARLTRRAVVLPAAVAVATLGRAGTASAMPAGLADSTIKAAMHLAAGKVMTAGAVPASVAQLVGGEMRTMIFTKWTLVAAGLLTTGSVAVGIGVLAADRQSDPADPAQAPARVAPAQAPAKGDEADKAKAENADNLKLIGLAMHNFAFRHDGAFPAAAIRKDGKPLLSWRVAILPYLDQGGDALYNKFHLDEPWDSPHNKPLLDLMPAVYAPVSNTGKLGHSTHYQVFAGPGALFRSDEGTKIADIKDGTSMTILVVEAAKPVPWTKPEDLPFDAEKPLPELGGQIEGGFCAGFADGSVRFIEHKVAPNILKALITPRGGENVTGDQF
jgi:RNA polymerase sigma factor (sigma-70 family)